MNESHSSHENQPRKLAHGETIKEFIEHEGEHFFARIQRLVDTLINSRDWTKMKIKDGDLEVERFGKYLPLDSGYFHVKHKGKEFFLNWRKRNIDDPLDSSCVYDPMNELKSTTEAKEVLKNIEGVEVTEPQYAYSSQSGHSFFASWKNLPLLSKIMQEIEKSGMTADPMYQSILERYERATSLLQQRGYKDLGIDHAFYDRERDTIVFFDLHREYPSETS